MTDDKKLEELKMTAYPFILLYQSIYEKMGFVEGNEARTSATATVFISTKDEWKSAEYERKQEARKQGNIPRASTVEVKPLPGTEVSRDIAKPRPSAVEDFKTALDMSKEAKVPEAEPPKKGEPDPNIFGTDRWGKAWPTSLVCLNLVPTKEDSKKFELCGGVAKVHRSTDPEKAGSIFAICPKCNIFLKHDGKPGKPAKPQE
jgi:hypothetical protein